MSNYCIAIVDDDENVRTSMANLLRAAGHEVEDFPSPTFFLDAIAGGKRYDCVLLDERMVPKNGLETYLELRARDVDVPAVMVTGVATIELTMRAVEAGFSYVMEKPVRAEELISRVEKYSAQHQEERNDKIRRIHEKTKLDSLSERELQVLELLAQGLLNKQIAAELGVGLRTVETYRNRVMSKISATCFADAIAFAISVGLRKPGVRKDTAEDTATA